MSRRWRQEPDHETNTGPIGAQVITLNAALPASRIGHNRPVISVARVQRLHPLMPDLEVHELEVSVIFGTYNRFQSLQRAVDSVRRACAKRTYEIVVCDGGSTDGTVEWLQAQSDVVYIAGDLNGAVKAFNMCFEKVRGQFILNLNDDAELHERCVELGVRHFVDPLVGQVAFSFSIRGQKEHTEHAVDGMLYVNYGLTRTNVARAIARICGGFWAPVYYTYGGDTELSMWVHRLGYKVVADARAVVIDHHVEDKLRKKNSVYRRDAAGKTYRSRWPSKDVLVPRGSPPHVTPQEENKLVQVEGGEPLANRWSRLRSVDPIPGQFPLRERLRPERVLHAWIVTADDPQQSQGGALRVLGSQGYVPIDWLKAPHALGRNLIERARTLQPTVAFIQIQGPQLEPEVVRALREAVTDPSFVIAFWSGDVGRVNGPWTGFDDGWSHRLSRQADVMLYTGTGQVQMQRERGMQNAAYLQIGFDEARYHARTTTERTGVVFLGQNYGQQWFAIPHNEVETRRRLVERLREVPGFRAYGQGWAGGPPVAQAKAGDVLRGALLTVSVSLTSHLGRYSSDRLFRAMACGSTALVKRFEDMEGLGLQDGVNCLVWDDVGQAVELARRWLEPGRREELLAIGAAGAKLMREHHTWGVRMEEFAAILRALRGQRY